MTVWSKTYRRSSRPAVLTHRRADGTLMAILPLYEARRRPISAARFVGMARPTRWVHCAIPPTARKWAGCFAGR